MTHVLGLGKLYRSRLTALESHETLHHFLPAFQDLSKGGMSEDESDHAGTRGTLQGRRYKIVKPKWRSPEVTKWLRTLDLFYAGSRINEDGTSQPGNQFRQCYSSELENIGNPIVGLPRNFYNEQWLRTLSPQRREKLLMQPEIDIKFSVEERRQVVFCAADTLHSFGLSFVVSRLNILDSKDNCRKTGLQAQPKQIVTLFLSGC